MVVGKKLLRFRKLVEKQPMGLLSQNSCVSDHRIHSDTLCTRTMALAVWLEGSQLRWGWGILLMGGEPIKLTELRVLCMERNWQSVLASGATEPMGGLVLT